MTTKSLLQVFADAKHPIWTVMLLVVMATLFALQSNRFDGDEIRYLLEFAGIMGFRELMSRRGNSQSPDEASQSDGSG